MQETSYIPKRLIYFRGHEDQSDSALITRICKNYETISDILSGECATRTLSNLYNLHAVRGCILPNKVLSLDSSMSGPHHYFGFILPTNTHIIKFDKLTGYPTYYKITDNLDILDTHKLANPEKNIIKLSNYNWISGKVYKQLVNTRNGEIHSQINRQRDKQRDRQRDRQRDSLFDNPGILYLDKNQLQFNVIYNGADIDLTSFRAQIVHNNKPFTFNQNMISKYKHAQHKLRVITYNYGSNYVNDYLMSDSGIFIERHEFIQAITPMNSKCTGFVILGRINNTNTTNTLELIAVSIPFGCTLLVEPWTIHGDSTLCGMYMMAMTGNHNAMQTADTVFLKNSTTNCNISTININVDNINKPDDNSEIIDDILMTNDKMLLSNLKKYDDILKKSIKNTINYINPLFNLFWQPVMLTGNKFVGWYKTLGMYLP